LVVRKHLVEFLLELVDLSHVLVLDPKVAHLDLDVVDLRAQFVFFLHSRDQHVEILLERLDFLVDVFCNLVLRGVLEHGFFDNLVYLLYLGSDADRAPLQVLDLFDDFLDAGVLALDLLDDLVNALEILVAVDVFGNLVPLLLHELHHLLLVLNLLHCLFELFLKLLYLFALVVVLNSLVLNLLFNFLNFIGSALFVALPLFPQLIKFFVDFSDFRS